MWGLQAQKDPKEEEECEGVGLAMEGLRETLSLTNRVPMPSWCGKCLSWPPRVTQFQQRKSTLGWLLCPSPCQLLPGTRKRTQNKALCPGDEKATPPLAAVNFTVIIAQNFCNAPLLAFRGTVPHFMYFAIYPRTEKLLLVLKQQHTLERS